MKVEIQIGITDYTALVFIPDPASTTGAGKTGLVAANLTVSYTRVETDNDVTVTDVTSSLNNLSALTDAHNDWGLLQVSATLAPGLYRLDIADAVFASGAWVGVVQVQITSGLAAVSPMEFVLRPYNPNDGVRLGLTALPNAAAEAAGGLYTRGTGAGQLSQATNGELGVVSSIVSAGRQAIADTWTARNIAGGSSTGRTNGQAMATLRNKQAIVAGTYTVYDTDDTTPLFEAAVSTAAGNPMSAWDPST